MTASTHDYMDRALVSTMEFVPSGVEKHSFFYFLQRLYVIEIKIAVLIFPCTYMCFNSLMICSIKLKEKLCSCFVCICRFQHLFKKM